MSTEQWQHGDVVMAADGELWRRAADRHAEQGWPWAYVWSQEGSVEEDYPPRPLTLLVRGGQPVLGSRWTPGAPAVDLTTRLWKLASEWASRASIGREMVYSHLRDAEIRVWDNAAAELRRLLDDQGETTNTEER
jgi:hypothetical protein